MGYWAYQPGLHVPVSDEELQEYHINTAWSEWADAEGTCLPTTS